MMHKINNWKQDTIKNTDNVIKKIKKYFDIYGGFYAVFTSIYFWSAFIINIFMITSWTSLCWIQNVKSIIPSIVGFSLGAYAILAGFGTDHFQKFISLKDLDKEGISKDEEKIFKIANTMYTHINTTFIHYILVQMLSLLLAVLCDSLFSDKMNFLEILVSFIGNLMFIYSLTLSLAAVFVIFDVANLYQEFNNIPQNKGE